MKINQLRSYDLYVQNQSKKKQLHIKSLSYSLTMDVSLAFQSSFQIYSLALFYLKHINFTYSSFFCSKLYYGNFGYLNDYF